MLGVSPPRGRTKSCIPYLDMGAMPIFVGYAPDQKAFTKELKRLGIEDMELVPGNCVGMCHTFKNKDTGCVICIVGLKPRRGDNKEFLYPVLAHEAVHIWQEIEEYVNEEAPGREIEAYNIGYITQFLCEEYVKAKKK